MAGRWRSDIIWAKPNPMPESVTDRPTKAHEYVFLLTKSPRYYWDGEAVKENFADERMGGAGALTLAAKGARKYQGIKRAELSAR
jgi:DNA modification methylase